MKSPLLLALLLAATLPVTAASSAFTASDLQALSERLETLEREAPHPLFARHCRSLRLVALSEWARGQLYPADSPMPARIASDLAAIRRGLDRGNDRWEAYRDAGQPLLLAFLSDRDQTLQTYHLVLPRDWDETRPYPLYLELHAYGGPEIRPLGWTMMTLGEAPDFERKHARVHMHAMVARDGFHVLPYGRGNSHYEDIGEIDVWEALADAEATVPIDPRRRYLYGFSMGGSGTYLLGGRKPELWAAVAILGASPGLRDAPESLAHALAAIPVFLWSGEKDKWFDGARRKGEVLTTTGRAPREIVFAPEVGHSYLAGVQQQAHAFLQRFSRPSGP